MREVDYKTGYNLRDMHNGRIDSRTSIEKEENWFVVRLHGNEIARYDGKTLEIDSCGYYTLTTTNRLNGILYAFSIGYINRKNGSFYINNEKWDGSKRVINIC